MEPNCPANPNQLHWTIAGHRLARVDAIEIDRLDGVGRRQCLRVSGLAGDVQYCWSVDELAGLLTRWDADLADLQEAS